MRPTDDRALFKLKASNVSKHCGALLDLLSLLDLSVVLRRGGLVIVVGEIVLVLRQKPGAEKESSVNGMVILISELPMTQWLLFG